MGAYLKDIMIEPRPLCPAVESAGTNSECGEDEWEDVPCSQTSDHKLKTDGYNRMLWSTHSYQLDHIFGSSPLVNARYTRAQWTCPA
jgi:hypothetical protein